MAEKTQKEMMQEVHQGFFGVKGTSDKGMVGDFKEVKDDIKLMKRDINGEFDNVHNRVTRLSTKVWFIIGVLGSGSGGVGIWKLVETLSG